MSEHYYKGLCYKNLWPSNWIVFIINILAFMLLFSLFYISFLMNSYFIKCRKITLYVSLICFLINLIFVIFRYMSNHSVGKRNLLTKMYFISSIGFGIVLSASLISKIYNPYTYFISLLLIFSSIGIMYYIKNPVYLSNKLSLSNIFSQQYTKINFNHFIIVLLFIMYAIAAIIAFSVKIIIRDTNKMHIHKILFGKYFSSPHFLWLKRNNIVFVSSKKYKESKIIHFNPINHLLNHYYYPNHNINMINRHTMYRLHHIIHNSLYLNNFENVFNNFCYHVFLFSFIILIFSFLIIIILSLIYSDVNNISRYKVMDFLLQVLFYIFDFIFWTIPTIFAVDGVLVFLEKHPSLINTDVVYGIAVLLPFIEAFYVLKLIKNLISIHD